MSYLDLPRIHFNGRFQADVSTVNNDVRHYKNDAFLPQFHEPMINQGAGNQDRTNGYWNPQGSGAWRLIQCTVTGVAATAENFITDPSGDPLIGCRIGGSDRQVAAKLVDLDPQQQLASEIWGLVVSIVDPLGNVQLESDFEVAAFIDLWKRQQVMQSFDQTLAAAYQSQLRVTRWGNNLGGVLAKLKNTCQDSLLSIRFNVFGFDRNPDADDYTTGRIVGTIGPANTAEPVRFTAGRQLVAPLSKKSPFVPQEGIYGLQAVYDSATRRTTIDLGNSLPIYTAGGDLVDVGELYFALCHNVDVKTGEILAADQLTLLKPKADTTKLTTAKGQINYLNAGWYPSSAGVVDLQCPARNTAGESLDASALPFAVVTPSFSGKYRVMVRESSNGLYVRADQYVYRMQPGETKKVRFYATRYGKPCTTTLKLFQHTDFMGGSGRAATLNGKRWPIPEVGKPEQAICYSKEFSIDHGCSDFDISIVQQGPGNPRGYVDGQVYGIGYKSKDASTDYIYNPWNFISVLAFEQFEVPAAPTWYRDIEPIFVQYGNLYPIMGRRLLNMGDYDSVVQHIPSLRRAFSMPISNPGSMPVSRDLSDNKRTAILKWLKSPGKDGLALKGTPDQRPTPTIPENIKAAPFPQPDNNVDSGGKMDFMLQVLATRAKSSSGDRS